MRKINNPFPGLSGNAYRCFGCSPFNGHGLQLQFQEDDGVVFCRRMPKAEFEGWKDVVHGGILATIMDELGSWFILTQHKTASVSSELNIKYLKPVRITKGEIRASARFLRKDRQTVTLSCVLTDGEGTQCAVAEVTYFIFPQDVAAAKYNYPGAEAFYS